jgi:ribosomal protein L9
MSVKITSKANEKGNFYAPVDARAITVAIKETNGVTIEVEGISLKEWGGHIKSVGEYKVPIMIGKEKAVLNLLVQK